MNLFPIRDCWRRVCDKKIALMIYGAVFLCFTVLGICFIKTPAIYEYHLNLCDKFVDRVCYSDRSVIVIFFERSSGHILLLAIALLAGVNMFAVAVPTVIFVYRAYTFGGSLYIFFNVYRLSGALIVGLLYLPVHLFIDVVLLSAILFSLGRAPRFSFCRQDFTDILRDFIVLGVLILLICLLEAVLLLALFHPLGNII